jgi:hypothetical protein
MDEASRAVVQLIPVAVLALENPVRFVDAIFTPPNL